MHPKRGELFDRFFPADMESMGGAMLTKLCRTDDERIASSPKHSADLLQVCSQTGQAVSSVIGHPVIDHIIWVRGFPIVRSFARNESNAREPIPLLQLGTDIPELLCLLLRKGWIPYQHGIVSRPIKRDAGRNHGIAILDEIGRASCRERVYSSV